MKTLQVRNLEQWRRWLEKHHAAASRYFEALSPSKRRRYFAWIESAKREETKRGRLEEAIRLLAAGKELGLK